jgi:5-methylcytosine-specific restriction endonuclease McrA
MGYRETWFKHNKPVFGKYRCEACGKWYPKDKIEIDHRIPKRKGGTDDLWNLQPMCRHCNRSKNARQSHAETAGTLVRAAAHGDLGKAMGGMAVRGMKDAIGLKYKRR